MLLYIITPRSIPEAMVLSTERRQSGLHVTLLCALLLISAQAFAYAHLHSGIDHAPTLDCNTCTVAKHQLLAIIDGAVPDQPLVLAPSHGVAATVPAPATTSAPAFQARAPPRS
jgi:hypothetical protein